jgi:pimeloyl-ACP methyl ester carboxylesterase
MRHVIRLQFDGRPLIGTVHVPTGARRARWPDEAPPNAEGVVLFGFSRAWEGDLGVCAADRMSESGYTVFRIDLPGLGDSPGDLPTLLNAFFRFVQSGGYGLAASAAVTEIRRRYGFGRVIVGGFCGWSLPALDVADRRDDEVKGVIALDPTFDLMPAPEAAAPGGELDSKTYFSSLKRMQSRLRSPRAWLRFLSGRSDYGHFRSLLGSSLQRFKRGLRPAPLPPDANVPILEAWWRLLARNLPILVFAEGGEPRRQYYLSYGVRSCLHEGPACVRWVDLENTNHAMVAGGAKELVAREMTRWLRGHFPVAGGA